MTTNFVVQIALIEAFSEILEENTLDNTIIGTADEAVIIEVEHLRKDRDAIDELAELIEEA